MPKRMLKATTKQHQMGLGKSRDDDDEPISKRTRSAMKPKPIEWSRLPNEVWLRCWNNLLVEEDDNGLGNVRLVCRRWQALCEKNFYRKIKWLEMTTMPETDQWIQLVGGPVKETDKVREYDETTNVLMIRMDRLATFLPNLKMVSPMDGHGYREEELELRMDGQPHQNDAVMQILSKSIHIRPSKVIIRGDLSGPAANSLLKTAIGQWYSSRKLWELHLIVNMTEHWITIGMPLPDISRIDICPPEADYDVSIDTFKAFIQPTQRQSIDLRNAHNIDLAFIREAVKHWKQLAIAKPADYLSGTCNAWYFDMPDKENERPPTLLKPFGGSVTWTAVDDQLIAVEENGSFEMRLDGTFCWLYVGISDFSGDDE